MRRFQHIDPRPENCEVHGDLAILRKNDGGRLSVKAWRGKQSKPYAYYSFRSEAQQEAWIAEQIASEAASIKAKAERKLDQAKRKADAAANIQVGVILHGSWGYDQTNCELYEVVERKGLSVLIRPSLCEASGGNGASMSENLKPIPGQFSGPAIRKMITASGVKLHEHCSLSPADPNRSHHSSWGH